MGKTLYLALGIAAMVAVVAAFVFRPRPERPFSSAEWIAGTPTERGRMAGDLVRGGSLIGQTKEQVLDRLGKADFASPNELAYDLGVPDRLRSNPMALSYALRVRLDGMSRVTGAYIAD